MGYSERFAQAFVALLVGMLVSEGALALQFQPQGIDGELLDNVQALLTELTRDPGADQRDRREAVREAVRQGLRPFGYYRPRIRFETQKDSEQILRFQIDPGEPVRLERASVVWRGAAQTDPDFGRLMRAVPAQGVPLRHPDYDGFKNQINTLAMQKGYFDGEFRTSRLAVSVPLRQGFWDIDYDSGERYRFGPVQFEGSQIDTAILQSLLPFGVDAPYDAAQLAEFNRRLSATGWFQSALVTPQFDASEVPGQLPLKAELVPRVKNSLEVGLGFSSDTGPRAALSWLKPWVNRYGHSLSSQVKLSGQEQLADFNYKIPVRNDPLRQYYTLSVGMKRTSLNDTDSRSLSALVSRHWERDDGWSRAVNVQWSQDRFTQAQSSATTMLVYPGISLSRVRSHGGLLPDWGGSQRYTLDVSHGAWGSDVDFVIAQAQNTWIRSLGAAHRFIFRGTLGWIYTNAFDRVPPDLRFFAGGDRSVRGYGYKKISPVDAAGDLTGGTKMITGSLEYQYNLRDKWWGAVFIDSGQAVRQFSQFKLKTGIGAGIRWLSPIGPVKIDLAVPVGDAQEKSVQLYFGLGAEL